MLEAVIPAAKLNTPALGGHEGGQFDGATAQGILQALTLIEISRCPAIPNSHSKLLVFGGWSSNQYEFIGTHDRHENYNHLYV